MLHSRVTRKKHAPKSSRRPGRLVWGRDGYFPFPAMEVLEERCLLAADITFAQPMGDGVLLRTLGESLPMSVPAVRSQANVNGTFDIQLEKSPALLANPAASAAFDAAAAFLESIFFDPITVIVDADFAPLAPGVIGATFSSSVSVGLAELRTLLIADAQAGETLPSQLPTLAQAQVIVPPDDGNGPFTLAGGKANRATLKALGVPEADLPGNPSQFNPSVIADMSMTFSSDFAFDFDPSNGIGPNLIDFVGVAIHEMGHGLGFVSSVDTIDAALQFPGQVSRAIEVGPLDFFRLRPGAGSVNFTTSPRVLTTEGDAVFFDGVYNPAGINIPGLTVGDVPLSTGAFTGDGNQASHWKADDITGVTIGLMDPTIADGQLGVFSAQDARAFGLIGYDLIERIPPVTLSIGGVSQAEGDEGTKDFVFTVIATGTIEEPFTVDFETVDVTATASVDYNATSGTLSFTTNGPTAQTITVAVIGDIAVESNETFLVRLSNATEPAVLGTSDAVGEIVNDDVEVSIDDATLVEGHSGTRNMVFTISTFGTLNKNASVSYTTLNGTADGATDYLPRVGVMTFSPQVTSGTVTVPIVGDTLNEGPEQLFVVLLDPQGIRIAKGVGTGMIIDDDSLPAFYVNDVQVTSKSTGAASAVFTIALDAASGHDASVEFATADGGAVDGVDYIGQSGMLTFTAGMTTAQVTVPVMTSADPSPNKKFFLNLSSPQHATIGDAQGAATMVFADPPPDQWIIDNGDAAFSRSGGGWTNLTNTLAYGLDYEYHAAGSGSAAATWTFTALASGSYEVFARWTAFVNRATNAPYAIIDGSAALGTTLGTVQVNQQAAPTGELSDGVTWQSLGTFAIGGNTLTVRLSNNANGLVIADAVRIVADGIPPQVAEINVSGGQQSIGTGDMTPTENDDTEFGAVAVGSASPAHVFTVTNTGNAVLALTGSPPVTISGAGAADFVVTTQPAAAVQPGRSTTFQIEFHPTASGLRQAVVTIANNDDSENPYTFMVQGTGTGTGVEVVRAFAHNDAFAQDVNADSRVSPIDVLIVINNLLARNAAPAAAPLAVTSAQGPSSSYYVDVNADGRLSPIDVLMVINYLLRQQAAAPRAAPLADTSAGADPALTAVAVDRAIALVDDLAETSLSEPARGAELAPLGETAGDKSTAQSPTVLADAAVSASFGGDDEESDEGAADLDPFDPLFLAL